MAPKKTAQKKKSGVAKDNEGKQGLVMPSVPAEDLQKAKAFLEDQANKKKAQNDLRYWLHSNSHHDEFLGWPMPAKRKFLESFTATSVMSKLSEKSLKATRMIETTTSKEKDKEWMSKEQMISTFGEKKTASILSSDKVLHRPCRFTGLDDEWNREYKVGRDKENEKELERRGMELDSAEAVSDEARCKEVLASFDSASRCMTINDVMLGSVKREPTTDSTAAEKESGDADDLFREHANQETIDSLNKDPRKVLRNVGDCITNAKFAFSQAEKSEYTEKLAADLKKNLSALSAAFKKVEHFCLVHREDSQLLEPALVVPIAEMVDNAMQRYNILYEMAGRFFPTNAHNKKK